MDSLQLSELDFQTFFGANKGELASKKFYVESVDCPPLDILDPVLERALDFTEYMTSDIANSRFNIYTQISSGYLEHQSLPQVVLDATAVVHEEKYPGEGSVLPPPVVNFLEPGQSPEPSDVTSYYSDDSSTTPHHMPEFSQLTSPGAETPSTSFQWPSCSNLKREHYSYKPSDTSSFGLKQEEYGLPSCQQSTQHAASEVSSFPFATSPTTSLPSPASTVYSVSSPGTPGPSSSTRGRRPHGSAAPYSTKSRRRQVEKGTEEYVEKRARNNVAVRKSRAKAKEKQRETEGRVRNLLDQNEQLQKKVDLLTKELTVLKGLFMNIGTSIPDDFLKMIGDS
uniref:CCAAT enhancer binding protein n=1 Tax=Ambigolimax valentianus TaxID=1338344 RepID=Q5KSL1_9EUPU|nr:CCAAT enhancer binding protein [Ambigolimax valentianus]